MDSKVLVRNQPLLANQTRELRGHLLTFHSPSKDEEGYMQEVAHLRPRLSKIRHRFIIRLNGLRSPKFKGRLPQNVTIFDRPSLRADEYTLQESGLALRVGWNSLVAVASSHTADNQLSLTESVAIRIIGLLRSNADVGEIAAQVKLDPGIQFNIVRYLNAIDVGYAYTGGFKNFEHSIMFMGYKFFARWMSTYLMYSRLESVAPAIYQLAITRGRLMESMSHLVGLSAVDRDSLYITGVFSLLDRAFGQPIDQILAGFDPKDVIVRTLLGEETAYLPLLRYVKLNEESSETGLWNHVEAQGWPHREISDALIDSIDYAQRVDPSDR